MKNLKDILQEFSLQKYNVEIDNDDDLELFEVLENNFEKVSQDQKDEHRWYTYWRHVYKVTHPRQASRYYAIKIPEMKGEESSWSDIGFTMEIDNAYEVFPKQVSTTIYE